MKILVLHLSDLHLSSIDDSAATRLLLVGPAALMEGALYDACFIVVSGDVTNTGSEAEFDAASLYLTELRSSLLAAGIPQVELVTVPGNHDCDLTRQDGTRVYLLETLRTFIDRDLDYTASTFDSLLSVQSAYFNFDAALSHTETKTGSQKLYNKRLFSVDGKTVTFHCFNTAWLSRRHEIQSELYIPSELFEEPSVDNSLSISVFHHPYNWLSANNYRAFQAFIERSSNIALCGHEHEQRIARVSSTATGDTDYLHAPAFSDPEVIANGFAMLTLDFDQSEQTVTTFTWQGSRFTVTGNSTARLHKQQESTTDPFELTQLFSKKIQELGIDFHHPRCQPPHCELRLQDLFVYPDLKHQTLDRILGRSASGNGTVKGEEIADFVTEKKLVMIFGAESSGKTALAKTLFQDFRKRQYLPILLDGQELRLRKREGQLRDLVKRTIVAQYGDGVVEQFLQFSNERKVLIIDGLDKARLSRVEQEILLQVLLPYVGRMLIFASDVLQVQDMTSSGDHNPFRGFERCTIKEFGRFHRFKLSEKWIYFGREQGEDSFEIDKLVLSANKTLATLLGRNVLPHQPIIILHLLNLLESGEVSNTTNGSYGYMYEVLIKGALARTNAQDVEVKTTYISRIGHAMFSTRQRSLTDEELSDVHDLYLEYYDMDKSYDRMKSDLVSSGILVENSPAVYRFKYPYILYYSVAKYFSDHRTETQEELRHVADHLYSDLNANVLIFYIYLTKDMPLIKYMVDCAKLIYCDEKACDMDDDVKFLNDLHSASPPPLVLDCADTRENRETHNRKQDEAEEAETASKPTIELEVSYDSSLEEFIKLGFSFKTLHILGQILRNFTGSLEGPVKHELTRECYALGMRTLQRILGITSDLDMMRQYIGSLIVERTGVSDKQELAGRTDLAIVWLSIMSGFGFVKRISYAVGHADLSKTYRRVLEESASLSTSIIDVSIKLDHSERIPEKELRALKHRVAENTYAAMILRDLVADFLYLYNVDYQTMQMLGSMWNISVSPVKYLANRSKKE